MTILVCGSIAYDTIMVFPDQFKKHILPEQIHILNVAFLVPEMRREFGGTAGNIAYNLNLLGNKCLVMATVGDDADAYRLRFEQLGIDTRLMRHIPDTFTAQAFITTDQDDNQITAFHPGAMNFSYTNKISAIEQVEQIKLAILAPDGSQGMLDHSIELQQQGIKFLFDPGQGLPMFSAEELINFMRLASYACFNDYEAKMVTDKTALSIGQLAEMVETLIITKGGEGSEIYHGGECINIPVVKAANIVDPTGCGDAYRAAILYGITHGYSWETSGKLASLIGSIKIASRGGQNHHFTWSNIVSLYQATFNESLTAN